MFFTILNRRTRSLSCLLEHPASVADPETDLHRRSGIWKALSGADLWHRLANPALYRRAKAEADSAQAG